MSINEKLNELKNAIDTALSEYFSDDLPQKGLFEAMRYSLLSGGKRVRGILVLEFCEACGGKIEDALPFACAIEMLHCYSLIHDDLPCMDNDDLRRGKPTNHKVYGECTATLAGDALQAAAFETMLGSKLPAEKTVKAAFELSFAAGEKGICGGQHLDMLGEREKFDISQVTAVHNMKTAAMIVAACKMGAIIGGGDERRIKAAEDYAKAIGLAFQIRDDILDVTSTSEILGKPVFSDEENGKNTFVSLLGIDECEKLVLAETETAKSIIRKGFPDDSFFCDFADYLCSRNT